MNTKRKQLFQNVGNNSFVGGKTLSTVDLKAVGDAFNWLLGKGNQTIPTFSPEITELSFQENDLKFNSSSYHFKLRQALSPTAIERVWNFTFSAISASSVRIHLDSENVEPSATTPPNITASIAPYVTNLQNFQIREFITAEKPSLSGTVETEIVMRVSGSVLDPETNGKYGPWLQQISCFEIDRPAFDPVNSENEGGIDIDSLSFDRSIYDAGIDQYSSIIAIARNAKLARRKTRNTNLFTWCQPYDPNRNLDGLMIISSSVTIANGFITRNFMPRRYRGSVLGSYYLFVLGGISGSTPGFGFEIAIETMNGEYFFFLESDNPDHRDRTTWKVSAPPDSGGMFDRTQNRIEPFPFEGNMNITIAPYGNNPATDFAYIYTVQLFDTIYDELPIYG